MIKILDCTLRDGAHVNKGSFGKNNIKNIINYLVDSKIDIIEIGFLQDKGDFSENTSYYNNFSELENIMDETILNKKSKFSMMIRVEDCDISKIIKSKYVNIIRFAFYYENMKLLDNSVKKAKEAGIDVYLNPLAVTTLSDEKKKEIYEYCNILEPKGVSIVDTFGSLTFKSYIETINMMNKYLNENIILGLHLHENQSLSFGMVQHTLLNMNLNRDFIVDGSLYGMGRIPGNLPSELIVDFLNKEFNKNYNIIPMLDCIDKIIKHEKKKRNWGYSPEYMLSASKGIHRSYAEFFIEHNNLNLKDAERLMEEIKIKGYGNRFNEKIAKDMLKKIKPKIYSIVPVKKNSSRLPNKNILPFGNSTLLEHKISQLKKVKGIDEIIVSSDSDIMLEKAKNMGVTYIKRPVEFANESKPLNEFYNYICDICKGNDDDILMWTCCTSPLFDEELLQKTLDIYLDKVYKHSSQYDCLMTVYNFQHYLLDHKGPLTYDINKKHSNSEDLKPLKLFTNGVIISTFKDFRNRIWFHGPKPYLYEVNQLQSIDIDTKGDYLTACAYYKIVKKL
jgi:4-hydroxy 2-oxovalerate aldolase